MSPRPGAAARCSWTARPGSEDDTVAGLGGEAEQQGWQVLACAPTESEVDLPFAARPDLLRAQLGSWLDYGVGDTIPSGLVEAINTFLQLVDATPIDRQGGIGKLDSVLNRAVVEPGADLRVVGRPAVPNPRVSAARRTDSASWTGAASWTDAAQS